MTRRRHLTARHHASGARDGNQRANGQHRGPSRAFAPQATTHLNREHRFPRPRPAHASTTGYVYVYYLLSTRIRKGEKMKRFPWLRSGKKTDRELPLEPPLWLGNRSNGEYFRAATKKDRLMRKLILETAGENARKVGMERRDFLASAMGMVTTLWAMNQVSGCLGHTSDARKDGRAPERDGSGALSDPDAQHCVPKDAMFEPDLACTVVGGTEFIFDVQTHWFKKEDLANYPAYVQALGALLDVMTEDNYVMDLFCDSDTTIAALTTRPGVTCTSTRTIGCGMPLSNESAAASRDYINGSLSHHTQRVVNHVQVMAQDPSGIELQLQIMEQMVCEYGVAAWKVYPGFNPGFTMDDSRGRAVVDKGLELGVPLFCIHKGIPIGNSFNLDANLPLDIGVVAAAYRGTEARFIVYHSAIMAGYAAAGDVPPEGPYDPTETNPTSVNALIRSLIDNGIGPNENVYADVGSAINQVQSDPVASAHFFGKLLKYVGTDNVLWGTDCIIYGSPQPFIEWFRALMIPQSMQDQYGYPPLDSAQKAKIFGLNAAKIYGIDVNATRCKLDQCPIASVKRRLDDELGPRRWMFREPSGPKTWGDFVRHSRDCVRLGRPG